jgi:uncharacterized protein YndB with AHSA1/START domain
MRDTVPANAQHVIQVRRTFAAPRERVFRAWTEPVALQHWLSPAGCATSLAQVDLRVGGGYRIGMQYPGQPVFYVSGVYREVRPPERLVFTWRWEEPDMDCGETLVSVEFLARGQLTEVILTHSNFPASDVAEQHDRGWKEIFDKLAATLIQGSVL